MLKSDMENEFLLSRRTKGFHAPRYQHETSVGPRLPLKNFFAGWIYGALLAACSFASAASISASGGTRQQRRSFSGSPISAIKIWPSGEQVRKVGVDSNW